MERGEGDRKEEEGEAAVTWGPLCARHRAENVQMVSFQPCDSPATINDVLFVKKEEKESKQLLQVYPLQSPDKMSHRLKRENIW